ncbi:GNAT family N-acetyltransferase [Streptomyces sp. JNUCC 64]
MSHPARPAVPHSAPRAATSAAPSAGAVHAPPPAVGLRVPTHEDAHHWHRVFDDAEVMEFLGGAAERSAYEEITARQRRHHAELGYCLWTVTAADRLAPPGADHDGPRGTRGTDGTVLGFVGAQPWPRAWGPVGEIEIGWRLGRAYWGRGYATAAALIGLDAVRAAGVRRVVAVVDPLNARSVAVTERLGMTRAEDAEKPDGQRVRVYRMEL